MKNRSLSFAFLSLLLAAVLTVSVGCSCSNEQGTDNPSSIIYPVADESSATDVTSSDISDTDIVGSDISSEISFTDISESTALTATDISPSDTTTASTTTAVKQTSASTASSDGKNAPGVHKPNYKTKYYIVVHTGSQSVAVYGKDANGYYNNLVKCFTCSTGTTGHETRTGSYTIWRKFRWRALVGGVYGQYNSSISKDYLFHSVPYLRQSVDRLDTEEYDKLGSPASHGCIRLCVRDAKWIYDNCAIDTQVYITNTSGPAGEGVPARNTDSAYNGWDPTDKWAKHNPYFYSPSTSSTTTTTAATTTSTAESSDTAESATSSSASTETAATTTTTTTTTTAATTTTTTTTAATTTTTTTAAAPQESGGSE